MSSGSTILLKKLSLYNQCHRYVEENAIYSLDSEEKSKGEKNCLLGSSSVYGFLALSCGIQYAISVKSGTNGSAGIGEEQMKILSSTLSGPFTNIHQRNGHLSFPTHSRKVWWLTSHSPGEETEGNSKTRQLSQLERTLWNGVVSLPLSTEFVSPSIWSKEEKKRRRGKNGQINSHEDEYPLKRWRTEVQDHLPSCRYGTTLLSSFYVGEVEEELSTVAQAARAPRNWTSLGNDGHSSVIRETGALYLMRRLKEITPSTRSFTSLCQRRNDVSFLQAYLNRHQWIVDQMKASPSSEKWSNYTEGERVMAEMKHTMFKRSRFSRNKESSDKNNSR